MEPGEVLGSSPRQPTFLRCLRILERADRADVTATRGAEAGGYKGRAPGAGADRERERLREALATSVPPPPEPRETDARSLGPSLTALPEHPIPLLTALLASVSLRSSRLFLRATMSSSTARALAVAVTLLHLTRLVSWTCLIAASRSALSDPFPWALIVHRSES